MEDDDWSDDDSDDFESNDLSTESDSEWSTLSSDVSDAAEDEGNDDYEATEIEAVINHESATRYVFSFLPAKTIISRREICNVSFVIQILHSQYLLYQLL